MIDLVIRNASRHDGSGGPPSHGDIGDRWRTHRLGRCEPIAEGAGREEVDVGGLAVAPGFIDLHTHSDVSLLSEPGCISAIEQGVTTQAVGLCGFSAGPGRAGEPGRPGRGGARLRLPGRGLGLDHDRRLPRGGRQRRGRRRTSTTFVGHNSLRRFVVGSANRPPTAAELDRMVDLDRRGDRRGRARLHDRAVVRARPVRQRSTSWRRSPVPPRRAGGRTTPTCGTDPTVSSRPCARRSRRPSGAGSSLNISHMYPHADLRARGGRRAARACSTTPAAAGSTSPST